MDALALRQARELIDRLPWQRAPYALVTPLVELVAGDRVVYWDAQVDPDPRCYQAVIVVFTARRLLVHRVDHQRGDRRAAVRTEVHLRSELLAVESAAQPETPYLLLERACDRLTRWWPWAGRHLDAACLALAERSARVAERWYSTSALEPPRGRCVDVRYGRLADPLRLPMQWSDDDPAERAVFDAFLPQLLDDLP